MCGKGWGRVGHAWGYGGGGHPGGGGKGGIGWAGTWQGWHPGGQKGHVPMSGGRGVGWAGGVWAKELILHMNVYKW